jgi:hypothetical protein
LESLKLIHLHGNRLSGVIPTLQLDFQHSSSYVSDCGNPSDFNPSLRCDDCTMCCRYMYYCHVYYFCRYILTCMFRNCVQATPNPIAIHSRTL